MRAEDIGLVSNKLVLGKHSGRNAFKQKVIDLNIYQRTLRNLMSYSTDLDLSIRA